ncbi:MAG: Flp pilus assembly complex ATPase component TadA [Magnetococcales bacterium]|nr:Flp pilus assembly complex ATPase component TadA [Magnetococcales bacterium]
MMQPPPTFRVRYSDGTEVDFQGSAHASEYILGRWTERKQPPGFIPLKDNHVSHRHCRLFVGGDGRWYVENLATTHGTYLDEQLIFQPKQVDEAAEIRLGATTFCILPFDHDADTLVAQDEAMTIRNERTVHGAITVTAADLAKDLSEDVTAVADALTEMRPQVTVKMEQSSGAFEPTARAEHRAEQATVLSAEKTVARTRSLERRKRSLPYSGKDRRSGVDRRSVGGKLVFQQAGANSLFQGLVQANLLDYKDVRAIFGKAQASGRSALYVLAGESSIHFWREIYTHIAMALAVPLINSEDELRLRTVEVPWLKFGLALRLRGILLKGGPAGKTLYATVDPLNQELADWIARQSGQPVEAVLAQGNLLLKVIRQLKEGSTRSRNIDEEENAVVLDLSLKDEESIKENLNDTNIPQMVNYLLHRGQSQGASDIHIEPGDDSFIVRNRVDGYLSEEIVLDPQIHQEVASRIKIISGMDVAERRRPQDGRFSLNVKESGRHFDVRVSSYPTVHGEKFVLRLLDQSAVVNSLEGLEMLSRDLQLLKERILAPFGMIMVSGPTGSGKTTTMYSCLGFINSNTCNILTVEDPVEFRMKGIHQMQVNPKIGVTFASGLRTILRQDPDVVMVGECRDQETAGMAIQAALTGHIVLTTIHANDALGVITRLLTMGMEPFMVANAVSLAISQRLVRVICQNCKSYVDGWDVLEKLEQEGISRNRLKELDIQVEIGRDYAYGSGCHSCRNTGYKGRRAVFEVLAMDAAIRSMIIKPDYDEKELRTYAALSGMTTLLSHGLQLVNDEVTTFDEVVRVLGEKY